MMTAPPAFTGATACVTCGAALSAAATTCPNCGTVRVRPATIAARMAALTLDIAAVAIVASVVLLSTRSLAFAAVAAAEATLALWILQARAGLSLGNIVMRLRTARVDRPYSPGGGRALVRGACTAAGLAVLAVGAWLLELTGVADRTGWRRSWGDRAAGTVVVEVPRGAARTVTADAAHTVAAPVPVAAASAGPVIAQPAVFASATGRRGSSLITGVPAAEAAVAPVARAVMPPMPAAPAADVPGPRRSTAAQLPVAASAAAPAAGAPAAPAPAASAPAAPEPAAPPLGSRRARRAATGDVPVMPQTPGPRRSTALPMPADVQTVLFAFDTGQRLEAPVPCAVVLGRHPSPMEDGDLVITVDDPQRTVSSLHARLEVDAEAAWVTDLGSTNGSDLLTEDGAARRIPPQQRVRVEDGTRVRIGDRTVTMTRLAGDSV